MLQNFLAPGTKPDTISETKFICSEDMIMASVHLNIKFPAGCLTALILVPMGGCAASQASNNPAWGRFPENPFVFALEQPVPGDKGGIFVHDLNADGLLDFVVTSDSHIGAYDHTGRTLWVNSGEIELWEYAHHPSAIAGDMDGDDRQEIAYLTKQGIKIVDAATGIEKKIVPCKNVKAMAMANLRGKGDRDVILQYSQTSIESVGLDDGRPLWHSDEFKGIEHSPLRIADMDGDGLDEVAGASIIDHDGRRMNTWDLGGIYKSADSLVIADIVPGYPLEAVIAEQRGANSHTDVVNAEKIVFRTLNPWNWEDPDKVAAGDFDSSRPGLEIFNRSSGGDGSCPRGREAPFDRQEECPWLIDATGEVICKYYVNDHKPDWWTGHGIEEICRIDWDGDAEDEIVGKERHKNGAAAIINAFTGEFLQIFAGSALRIYAADIQGDYREEVIMLDEAGSVKVFWNSGVNSNPDKPRYWHQQHYRRQKQNWGYYSP
jgi:hypothetical protein